MEVDTSCKESLDFRAGQSCESRRFIENLYILMCLLTNNTSVPGMCGIEKVCGTPGWGVGVGPLDGDDSGVEK